MSYLSGLDHETLFGKMTEETNEWSKRRAARRSQPSLLTSSQAFRKQKTDNMMRQAAFQNIDFNPTDLHNIAVGEAGKSAAFKGMNLDWSKGGKTDYFAKAFDSKSLSNIDWSKSLGEGAGSTTGLTAGGGNAAATNWAMKIASLIFGTALSGIAQRREKHNLEQQQIAALPVGVGNKDWGIFDFFTG